MNTQIYEQATEWFVGFRSGDVDVAARQRFDDWIRKSPEHLRAYLEITEVWQDAAFMPTHESTSQSALIEAARADDSDVIVPLASARREQQPPAHMPESSSRRSKLARYALAACLSIVVAVVGGVYLEAQRGTFTTGTGEQRVVNLADGSTIQLNAQSQVRVRYSESERRIELLRGQALFRVEKDRHRPFVVRSDTVRVRAVGTQFDVYRKQNGTTVTVLEGTVAVREPRFPPPAAVTSPATRSVESPAHVPIAAAADEFLLAAGDQVTLDPRRAPHIEKDQVPAATAWTRHQIVFKAARLPEVIAEFNRYNTRALVIESGDLSEFRVSGVYSSTNPTLLVRFLREQPGIHVRETDDAILISAGSDSAAR